MKQIKIIAFKEIKDIFRDKRTIVLSILIPWLLFPAIFYLMNTNLKTTTAQNKKYRSALVTPPEISINYKSKSQNNNIQFLHLQQLLRHEKITMLSITNPAADLKKGQIDLVLRYHKPKPNDAKKYPQILLQYNNTNMKSIFCVDFVATLLQKKQQNIPVNPVFTIKKTSIFSPALGNGHIVLSILLPALLFLFSVSTTMATAADLSSGEKERNTLESLLMNPIAPSKILIGKIVATSIIGIIGVTSFFAGIYLSYKINPHFFSQSDMAVKLSPLAASIILGFALIVILISAILELTIGVFAKTTREAQVYYLPILLLFSAIGYSTMTVSAHSFPGAYEYIPLFNIALTIKMLSLNIISTTWILSVFLQNLLVIGLMYFISLKLFKNEKNQFAY